MKDILIEILKNAKQGVRENEGKLPPIVFMIINNEMVDPFPLWFRSDDEKMKTFFAVGAYCREREATAAVLGLDGCSREVTKDNIKYFLENLNTERPSTYPKNLRNNYIILQYIDFLNDEENVTLFCKYKETDGKLRFGKYKIVEMAESIVVRLISDGWIAKDKGEDDN